MPGLYLPAHGRGQVAYIPAENFVSLKFRVKPKDETTDYTRYVTEFVLDEELACSRNELEICRFKLNEGAKLRTEYKDFYDIQTEFGTVNLVDADWAGRGGKTLSKEITDYFDQKVLECENASEQDIQFAYMLLQGREAVLGWILNGYIVRKTDDIRSQEVFHTEKTFRKLERILNGVRQGVRAYGTKEELRGGRMIIMD